MYDKKKIISLTQEYIDTEKDAVFAKVLMELVPMIDVILSHHPGYVEFYDDLRQEVLLVLWNRRKGELRPNILMRSPDPTMLFFSRIKDRVCAFLRRVDNESRREALSDFGYGLLLRTQNELLDPENIYIVKYEAPRVLYKKCVDSIKQHPGLQTYEERVRAMFDVRKMIEQDFGVRFDFLCSLNFLYNFGFNFSFNIFWHFASFYLYPPHNIQGGYK